MQHVPVRQAMMYCPQGDNFTGVRQRSVGPGACCHGVPCRLRDTLEGMHGRHMWLNCAILIKH